jgi:uncharacterized membrane protein YccC
VPGRAADKRAARHGVEAAASAAKPNRPEHVATDSDHWLQLHATDLIDRLQQTAETLDAREARLHAQIALHERREREFRLWSDSQRQELAELRREAARLRDRLQAEARRLVMSERGHSSSPATPLAGPFK